MAAVELHFPEVPAVMTTFDADAFKARTLREALACAACSAVPRSDRILAASLAAEVCDHVDWTEALTADLLLALRDCLDVPSAVEHIVDVVSRAAPDKAKVTGALVQLGHAAYEQRALDGLYMLTLAMLDEDAWADAVDPAWVEALAFWGQTRIRAQVAVGRLLFHWIPRAGARHEWLRRLMEQAPELLSSHWLPFTMRQEVHFAVPTVWAWRHFASHQDPDLKVWTVEAFGDQASKAIETLLVALAAAHAENDGATTVMSGWLAGMAKPE